MKKQLLALAALGILAAPLTGSVSAAIMPDQYETGEGFWAYQTYMPTSYPAVGYVENGGLSVRKVDAENGIFIKEGFSTQNSTNAIVVGSSINSQYTAVSSTESKLSLYSKKSEKIDVPDKYENQQCVAIGIKELDGKDEKTKYVGCGFNGTSYELMVGKINRGQVKIQKIIDLKTSDYVSFTSENFEGYTDPKGKHLAYTSWNFSDFETQIVNIQDSTRVNLTNKVKKINSNAFYIQAIGWKNGKFYFNVQSTRYINSATPEEIMEYDTATKKVTSVGKLVLPTTKGSFGMYDAILNDHKADDNFIYFTGSSNKTSSTLYVVAKMNIKNGKITELFNSSSVSNGFSHIVFHKLSFSNNGNFLGIGAGLTQQSGTSFTGTFSFELKTNKTNLISVAKDVLI